MRQESFLKKVPGSLLAMGLMWTMAAPAQNVYDTYNPWNPTMDSIVETYPGDNAVTNYKTHDFSKSIAWVARLPDAMVLG